ncbi:glycosyltransferase family 39 protein [Butyrivibrio sp. AC2005]|uniref:glycosyltransferase family 39 protein n=1 Tax=Butyrivibrio sp. AC2005 TaxID=1280672 RepID=UPI0004213E34|nr:glycosyltransferase family 39 protein [Butyrivibrio sp. AC2005]
MKSVLRCIVLSAVSAWMLFSALDFVFSADGLKDYCIVNNSYFPYMVIELGIVVLFLLVGAIWSNLVIPISVMIVFSYVSILFLPIVFAILYVLITIIVGESINKRAIKLCDKGNLEVDFLIGAMVLTIVYAVMSMFSIGGLKNLRIVFAFCAALAICDNFGLVKEKLNKVGKILLQMQCTRNRYFVFSLMVIPIIIQIGRLNSSIDYDSAWYGLRAPYILDNISGIYDKIPFTAVVYTYSKGFETYSLPLSSTDCYAFVPALNVIFTVMIIRTVYSFCKEFVSEKKSLFAAIMVSIVPGIMNMSTTAKSDTMTLMIQLFLMYFFVLYLSSSDFRFLGMTFAAYIYAQTLKPTSAVFSTLILLSVFYCLLLDKKNRVRINNIGIVSILLALTDLVFIWARTYILTGVPETQVWGGIFRKIGFLDKYPFSVIGISSQPLSSIFSISQLKILLLNLYDFLIDPRTESAMIGHIHVAWGSTFITGIIIVLIPCIVYHLFSARKRQLKERFIICVFILQLCAFIGIIMLRNWLDGNYFMLLYACAIIAAVVVIRVEKKKERQVFGFWFGCFYLCNILLLLITNWSMSIRFTEPDFLNKGYYNHLAEFEQFMRDSYKCDRLYSEMASDIHNKVFAVGDHISGARIPCVVEGDLDIGAYGNRQLATNGEFHKYIEFGEFDYIFVFSNRLSYEDAWYDSIIELFDARMISSVEEENGNILLRVGEADTEQSELLKSEFVRSIGKDT